MLNMHTILLVQVNEKITSYQTYLCYRLFPIFLNILTGSSNHKDSQYRISNTCYNFQETMIKTLLKIRLMPDSVQPQFLVHTSINIRHESFQEIHVDHSKLEKPQKLVTINQHPAGIRNEVVPNVSSSSTYTCSDTGLCNYFLYWVYNMIYQMPLLLSTFKQIAVLLWSDPSSIL